MMETFQVNYLWQHIFVLNLFFEHRFGKSISVYFGGVSFLATSWFCSVKMNNRIWCLYDRMNMVLEIGETPLIGILK